MFSSRGRLKFVVIELCLMRFEMLDMELKGEASSVIEAPGICSLITSKKKAQQMDL